MKDEGEYAYFTHIKLLGMRVRFWLMIFIGCSCSAVCGQSWQKLALPNDTSTIPALYATSSSLLVLPWWQPYYYISSGVGAPWAKINLPLQQDRSYRLEYVPYHFHSNELLLSYYEEGANICHYFLSQDGGKTQQEINPPFVGRTQLQNFYRVGDAMFLLTAENGNKSFYSKDKGKTWARSSKFYESDGIKFRNIAFPDTLFSSSIGEVNTWNAQIITGAEAGVKIGDPTVGAWQVTDRFLRFGGCDNGDGSYDGCQLYDVDSNGHATRMHVEALGYNLLDPSTYRLKSLFKTGSNLIFFYKDGLYETFDYGLSWDTLPMPQLDADESIHQVYKMGDHYLLNTLGKLGFKNMYAFSPLVNSLDHQASTNPELTIRYQPEGMRLTIQQTSAQALDLVIYNSEGKILYRDRVEHQNQEMDLSPLPKGVYMAQVTGGQVHSTKKIVVL